MGRYEWRIEQEMHKIRISWHVISRAAWENIKSLNEIKFKYVSPHCVAGWLVVYAWEKRGDKYVCDVRGAGFIGCPFI